MFGRRLPNKLLFWKVSITNLITWFLCYHVDIIIILANTCIASTLPKMINVNFVRKFWTDPIFLDVVNWKVILTTFLHRWLCMRRRRIFIGSCAKWWPNGRFGHRNNNNNNNFRLNINKRGHHYIRQKKSFRRTFFKHSVC